MSGSYSLSTVTAAPRPTPRVGRDDDQANDLGSRWTRWVWASAAIDLTVPLAVAREKQASGTRAP
jgi:hypothetical protein